MNGNRSLPQDLKDILENTDLKSNDISNIAIASLLNSAKSPADLISTLKEKLSGDADSSLDS